MLRAQTAKPTRTRRDNGPWTVSHGRVGSNRRWWASSRFRRQSRCAGALSVWTERCVKRSDTDIQNTQTPSGRVDGVRVEADSESRIRRLPFRACGLSATEGAVRPFLHPTRRRRHRRHPAASLHLQRSIRELPRESSSYLVVVHGEGWAYCVTQKAGKNRGLLSGGMDSLREAFIQDQTSTR